MEDRHKIRGWIQFACDCNEVSELAQTVIVEWNRRFTRRLGDGVYSPLTYRAKIRLSIPLWPRASSKDRMETVIHEACHVIVGYKHGYVAAHGSEWKAAMRKCGVEPLRLHSIDRTGLYRRQRQFILLDCPNETKCRCTTRQYNLLRSGSIYRCNKCGLHLHQGSAVEEDRTLQKS